MDRTEYLNEQHVAGFIEWLHNVIIANESFTQSFYPRNGRAQHQISLSSFRDAVIAYNFNDQNLGETQAELDPLAETIRSAIKGSDTDVAQQHCLLIACLRTLVWGGVTVESTISWLANRASQNSLHEALKTGTQALLSDNVAALDVFHDAGRLRSDSAATKLYSLADNRSIIYDNRVGASLAKLVCEYLHLKGIVELPETLAFMLKRGAPRRDPSITPNRRFRPKVTGYPHAVWNQRANWLVNKIASEQAVIDALYLFPEVSTIRAIESALFVMGDDIRNLSVRSEPENAVIPPIAEPRNEHDRALTREYIAGRDFIGYCVPTSHPFGTVMENFQLFRQQNPGSDDLSAFTRFLTENLNLSPNTARDYCYPIKQSQFNLAQREDELVNLLSENPLSPEAFAWLQATWQEERIQKIMVCTRCVGVLNRHGCTLTADQAAVLIKERLAGNPGSAQVIRSTGLSFGRHFGLLDQNDMPTPSFVELFE